MGCYQQENICTRKVGCCTGVIAIVPNGEENIQTAESLQAKIPVECAIRRKS